MRAIRHLRGSNPILCAGGIDFEPRERGYPREREGPEHVRAFAVYRRIFQKGDARAGAYGVGGGREAPARARKACEHQFAGSSGDFSEIWIRVARCGAPLEDHVAALRFKALDPVGIRTDTRIGSIANERDGHSHIARVFESGTAMGKNAREFALTQPATVHETMMARVHEHDDR